jgi:hypothetical protein
LFAVNPQHRAMLPRVSVWFLATRRENLKTLRTVENQIVVFRLIESGSEFGQVIRYEEILRIHAMDRSIDIVALELRSATSRSQFEGESSSRVGNALARVLAQLFGQPLRSDLQ